MRVGWLADDPGYIGGAELTQAEFRAAAPEGVEIVDCPPGGVVPGLDRYAIHNCVTYAPSDIAQAGEAPCFKYVNDVWPHGDATVKEALLASATLILCSPLQQKAMGMSEHSYFIPPPIDLEQEHPVFSKIGREGAVALGAWQNLGKGQQLLAEWAVTNGPLDVYGPGPLPPSGPGITHCGEIPHGEVMDTLSGYKTFVHLPTAIEPFGRAVVEAWAAGCDLVVNKNVGALYWIEEEPDALERAAKDYWDLVTA